MKRKALISGITGQDGSYLAEYLLSRKYEVFGIVRREAMEDETHCLQRIRHLQGRVNLRAGSLDSFPSLYKIFSDVQPDEIYHLAAKSFVNYSFEDEFSTLNTNITGTHYMLSAFKDFLPDARFYFAASSEMFGNTKVTPQNENTSFNPRSAYGISKVAGYHLARNYRESHDLFISNGILYNHESPRRGFEFVTRKITSHVAMIKLGLTDKLELGDLDSRRDWGHAKDYVRAMWLMLQQDIPDDFVICTGKLHSVREFCQRAFDLVGLDYQNYVKSINQFSRPNDVNILVGDPGKAKTTLGWSTSVGIDELIEEMVASDMEYYQTGRNC